MRWDNEKEQRYKRYKESYNEQYEFYSRASREAFFDNLFFVILFAIKCGIFAAIALFLIKLYNG